MDSRSPSGELVWSTKMALPPMVLMPASKLRRVRRLTFSNISTICLASRAWRYSRGLRFTSWPSLRMARTSALERSAMEHRSSPASRSTAARMSGSLSMETAGARGSMTALLATCLSSYGISCSCGCSVCGMLSEDFVKRADGDIDVGAFEDVGRQKAQDGVAGAVDDDAPLEHFGNGQLGQVRGIDLGCNHQSPAAHVNNGFVAQGQGAELCEEIVTDIGYISQQVFLFDGVDDGNGHSACQRATAEGSAMHACMDGARSLFCADDRSQGDAAGKRLGQRSDVRQNAVVLISAPLACAAHAGLNLIGNKKGSSRAGQRTRLGEELLRERAYAAFALDGFDEDGTDFIRKFRAQVSDIVELHKIDAWHNRAEWLAILGLVSGGDGAEGAAVKALLKGDKSCADLLAFAAQESGVRAGQLERAFPGLSAGVGKECAIKAGTLGKPLRQLRLALVEKQIRNVNEGAALFQNCICDGRMGVAQRVDADAAQQVEIAIALFVDELHELAANEVNGVAAICGKQKPCFGGLNLFESGQFFHFHLSWSVCPADR